MFAQSTHPETFGEWVRKRRKLLDMTQGVLAERASLSASAIRKIEADGRRPSRETAELLADALQVSADERDLFMRLARGSAAIGEALAIAEGDYEAADVAARSHNAALAESVLPVSDAGQCAGIPVVDAIARRPLPAPVLPIVGRAQEISQIGALLRDPQCRLLTIVGPGGIGKTRLALEVTRREQTAFGDGAVFVELSPLVSADYVPAAIAAALGLSSATRTDPAAATLDYLARRELLLVLDNMEHLLAAAEYVGELLASTPQVKLLVTSREHLNLSGEWVFEIQGLPFRSARSSTAADESAAATLFIQRARQADMGFVVDDDRREAVNRICALLGGMPLAIELAASWVRVLSPQEILEEMSRSIDFLAANRRDLPARHRSMRAVFDQSWALLGEREQRTLRRIAIFRGSFSREAVRAVADGSLGEIATLVAKSLLNHGVADSAAPGSISAGGAVAVAASPGGVGVGRYRVHEIVRQFALEHLDRAGEGEQMHQRLLAYYVQFADKGYAEATGEGYMRWINTLRTEIDNFWLAMEWGFVHDPLPALHLFCALRMLWEQRSSDEASEWMRRAIDLAERTPDVPIEMQARVYAIAAMVDRNHHQTVDRAHKAVALARDAGNERLVATVLPLLGHAAIREARPDEAQAYFDEALEIVTRLGNPALEATVRNEVGVADRYLGNYARSREHHERARALALQAGRPELQAEASLNLNLIAMRTGDYQQAQMWIEENLAISRAIGDRPAYGWALQSLVRCYIFQGLYENARVLLEQLRVFVSETPYRNQPENLLMLEGDFYLLQGDFGTAERCYRRSLETAQDPLYRAWCYRGLGSIARFRGDWAEATSLLTGAIAISEATNELWNQGLSYIMLGDVAHEMKEFQQEGEYLARAAQLLAPLGDKWGIARWCESSARHALALGDDARAARLVGAADVLRQAGGSRHSHVEVERNASMRARLEAQLGSAAYRIAYGEGEELGKDIPSLLQVQND